MPPNTIHTLADDEHHQPTLTNRKFLQFHLVTTSVLIINVLIFMFQVVMQQDWTNNMANQPFKTAYFRELWRYITHSFQHLSIFHLLFNMLALQMFGQPIEAALGSLPVLGMTFLFSILEGFLYTYTNVILSIADPNNNWLYHNIAGASSNLFAFLWIFLHLYGLRELNFCGLFTMPSWLYAFLLCFITLTNSFSSFLAHACGLVVGICYHYGILNYLTIPRVFLQYFENSTKFGKFIKQTPGYIFIANSIPTTLENDQFVVFKKKYVLPMGGSKVIKYLCCCFIHTSSSSSSNSSRGRTTTNGPTTTGPGRVLGSGNTAPQGLHPLAAARQQQQRQPPSQQPPLSSQQQQQHPDEVDHIAINIDVDEGQATGNGKENGLINKVAKMFSKKKKQGYDKFSNHNDDYDDDDDEQSDIIAYNPALHKKSTNTNSPHNMTSHQQQQQQKQTTNTNNKGYSQYHDVEASTTTKPTTLPVPPPPTYEEAQYGEYSDAGSIFGFDEEDLAGNFTQAGDETQLSNQLSNNNNNNTPTSSKPINLLPPPNQ